MSRIKLASICFLLILIVCQCGPTTKLKSIAKNALIEKYPYMKNGDILIRKKKMPFCSGLKVFNIDYFRGEDPSLQFLVIIDNKKDAHVFLEQLKITEINRLIADNINKNKNNLSDFINMFLFLFDGSKIISSYDDFDDTGFFKKNKDEIGSIFPMKFEIRENEITAEFFSCSEGSSLKKWNITLSHKGQVKSYSYKNLFVFGMAFEGEKWEIGGTPLTWGIKNGFDNMSD